MNVHERIKEVRLALKLSQVKFAEAVYISKGYIAGIELGHNKVNERLIQLVSTIFGVNKHWLVTGQGEMFYSISEQRMKHMANLFRELSPEFQDFILDQIEKLIKLQSVKAVHERAKS
jgi:transcriptional regulator with XRE-family HTH domain